MRTGLALCVALLLAGCASLPSDGPSARAVEKGAAATPGEGYMLVDLTYARAEAIQQHPPQILSRLAPEDSPGQIDRIGEGDVLRVSVFEPGGGPAVRSDREGSANGATQTYSQLVVDQMGEITVPFAGKVRVAGMTPAVAGAAVQRALRGRFANPQALVAVETNVANSVSILGEVKTGGRFPLTTNGNRVLDIVAAAGGVTRSPWDTEVTVVRGRASAVAPLPAILADPAENIRLAPGDRIQVAYKPRKFSTFGALAKSDQISIEDQTLSLAGALGRMGGLDNQAANPASVLLFRFERPAVAQALGLTVPEGMTRVPVVYRLNLRQPDGFFVAQKFNVQADDLIYATRADAAEVKKFFALVSSISQVAYDIAVVRVVN